MADLPRHRSLTFPGVCLAAALVAGCGGGTATGGPGGGGGSGPPLPGAWAACGTIGSMGPTTVALSADGRVLAAVFLDRHLEVVRISDGSTLLHRDEVYDPLEFGLLWVALSADGSLVALNGPTVRVFRVADGTVVHQSAEALGGLHFSPDGSTLVGVGNTREAIAIRLSDGIVTTRTAPGRYITDVAFSPSGELITLADDNTVRNEATGATSSLAGLQGIVTPTLSPSGRYIASLDPNGDDDVVRVYRVADRTLVSAYTSVDRQLYPASLFFSPDESKLLVSAGEPVLVLDVATGTSHGDVRGALPGGWVVGPGASPLVSVDVVGILVWEGGDLTHPRRLNVPSADSPGGERAGIQSVAVSRDGTRLAVAADDAVTLWELPARRQLWAQREGAKSVAFSPDGKRLLVLRDWIEEWPANGDPPASPPPGRCNEGWMAAYSPDGNRIGVGLPLGFMVLAGVDAPASGPVWVQALIYPAVAFSPDGLTIATSEPSLYRLSDGARVWPSQLPLPSSDDACSRPPISAPRGSSVDFSPDGKLLVAEGPLTFDSFQRRTAVYRTTDGSLVHDFGIDTIHGRPVFSPDGVWLAAGTMVMKADGSGAPILLDESDGQGSAVFAPDGTILISSGLRLRLFCPRAP